jgi:hypothetical protein
MFWFRRTWVSFNKSTFDLRDKAALKPQKVDAGIVTPTGGCASPKTEGMADERGRGQAQASAVEPGRRLRTAQINRRRARPADLKQCGLDTPATVRIGSGSCRRSSDRRHSARNVYARTSRARRYRSGRRCSRLKKDAGGSQKGLFDARASPPRASGSRRRPTIAFETTVETRTAGRGRVEQIMAARTWTPRKWTRC